MKQNRLTMEQTNGNIIFGYPPELPPIPEIVLSGKIYENNKPFSRIRMYAKTTWNKVKSFTRTGVRASGKV